MNIIPYVKLFLMLITLSLACNSNSFANNLCQNSQGIFLYVTFENGNCDNLYAQIKTSEGKVVLQGYTAFNGSYQNVVIWHGNLPPAGNYEAVVYYSSSTASTNFYWSGAAIQQVYVHFPLYAACGDD